MTSKTTGVIAVLILFGFVAILGNIGGSQDMLRDFFQGTGATTGPEDRPIEGCTDLQVTPSLDPNAIDIRNPGTAFTEATNIWRVDGSKAWNTFTQGTAFTPPLDTEIDIIFGITASNMVDNAYGPFLDNVWTGCNEDVSSWGPGGSMEVELYDDCPEGDVTATFYNDNHDASAVTMTAGSTKTIYLKFEATNEDYFGNPYLPGYPNVLCLDLNTTQFDEPIHVKVGGIQMAEVSTPLRHAAAAGKKAYCYAGPIVDDSGVEFAVRLDADDSVAPGVDDTAYLYAGNHFIHTETSNPGTGVENDEGTAVGTDTYDSLTIDVTA